MVTKYQNGNFRHARDYPEEVSDDPPEDIDPILNEDVVEKEYFEGDIVNVTKVDISEQIMQTSNGRNAIRNTHQLWPNGKVSSEYGTGKSFSEAFILASINPQYDKRLTVELPVQYMKTTSSEHQENILCTQIVFCFSIQNNLCTQHVLGMF